MARRRTNWGKYLAFFIIVGAGIYSYFHSQEVYSGYMKFYYEKIRGLTVQQQVEKAEKLYAGREYDKLRQYLKELTMVYPDNRELQKLHGLNLIKLGVPGKGAEEVLAASDNGAIPEKELEDTVQSLYEQRQFRDIVMIFKQRSAGNNSNLLYYYGVALFETGSHQKAADVLKRAVAEGRTDYESYHYAGKALVAIGDARASLPYLERARSLNKEDNEVARSLANAYRKLGRYNDAAKLLRKIRGE